MTTTNRQSVKGEMSDSEPMISYEAKQSLFFCTQNRPIDDSHARVRFLFAQNSPIACKSKRFLFSIIGLDYFFTSFYTCKTVLCFEEEENIQVYEKK
jgi:hypothetical protein